MCSCEICVDALSNIDHVNDNMINLVFLKSLDGMKQPSNDVIRTCKQCEKIIRHDAKSYETPNPTSIICMMIESFIHTNIFKNNENHSHDETLLEHHVLHFIRAISEKYTKMFVHLWVANIRDKSKSERQFYNKLILFKGN